jgi:hypothetical protein
MTNKADIDAAQKAIDAANNAIGNIFEGKQLLEGKQ